MQDTQDTQAINGAWGRFSYQMEAAGFSDQLMEAVNLGWHLGRAFHEGLGSGEAITRFCMSDPEDVARIVGADDYGEPVGEAPEPTVEAALTYIESWSSY